MNTENTIDSLRKTLRFHNMNKIDIRLVCKALENEEQIDKLLRFMEKYPGISSNIIKKKAVEIIGI